MLTLTFLGVGSAFSKRNYQSNALVEAWTHGPEKQSAPDEVLLIDFGATAPRALHELMQLPGFTYLADGQSINYSALSRVFITHLHSDHIGGLEELAIKTKYSRSAQSRKPAPKPELLSSEEVLNNLWEHSLKGGLGAISGREAGAADYFTMCPLRKKDDRFLQPFSILNRYEIMPFATDHVQMVRRFDWPSFGLLFRDRETGRTAVFSGDTRFDPEFIGQLMAETVISFHEVQFAAEADTVHSPISELMSLPEHVRRKSLLYHFDDDFDSPSSQKFACHFQGLASPYRRNPLF